MTTYVRLTPKVSSDHRPVFARMPKLAATELTVVLDYLNVMPPNVADLDLVLAQLPEPRLLMDIVDKLRGAKKIENGPIKEQINQAALTH